MTTTQEEGRALIQRCKERYDARRKAAIAALDAGKVLDMLDAFLTRHIEDDNFLTQDWHDIDLVQGWVQALVSEVKS